VNVFSMCRAEPKRLAKAKIDPEVLVGAMAIASSADPDPEVQVGAMASSPVRVGAASTLSLIGFPLVLGLIGAFFAPMLTGDGSPRLVPAVIGLVGGAGVGVLFAQQYAADSS